MALQAGGRMVSKISLGGCRAAAGGCMQASRISHAWYSSDAEPLAPGSMDPFTRSLQSKTEEEVFSLLEKARQQQQQQQDEEEDDDLIDVVNPETGEAYGPRGKEPTRFGDWEIKGRCTDFS